MKNKKGISPIVATVLIVLLVIAAVALMWSPIRNLIQGSGDEIESSCLLADVEIVSATHNNTDLIVVVKNSGSKIINGVQVVAGEDSEEDNTPLDANEQVSISITTDEAIGTVDAASIMGTGDDEKICQSSDSVDY